MAPAGVELRPRLSAAWVLTVLLSVQLLTCGVDGRFLGLDFFAQLAAKHPPGVGAHIPGYGHHPTKGHHPPGTGGSDLLARTVAVIASGFVPNNAIKLLIRFGKLPAVVPGVYLARDLVPNEPTVNIGGQGLKVAGSLYTLTMTDPDAPDPRNATRREILHWLVTNIPGNYTSASNLTQQATVVAHYRQPTPPIGTHRYILLLFEQKGRVDAGPQVGANFHTQNFTDVYALGPPLAATFFYVTAPAPAA